MKVRIYALPIRKILSYDILLHRENQVERNQPVNTAPYVRRLMVNRPFKHGVLPNQWLFHSNVDRSLHQLIVSAKCRDQNLVYRLSRNFPGLSDPLAGLTHVKNHRTD